ncbi:glycoside hydrolase family 9 protein [Confluentibacter sediminis]|uniref:glycoside hydrolase family 9 protein n=1 Tax=Confluentibacter sediminis TaxID=2219045 RepID=UPI000DAD0E3C|nr:glycoside hydrolase family 9 protein [Confluentibacter sediminis]
MKKQIIFITICFISTVCSKAQSKDIHVNSLGFLTNLKKSATISKECTAFNILDLKGHLVFSGKTTGPIYQKDVDQNIWNADFSEFTKSGDYILEIPNVGKSIPFKIADDTFNFAAKTSMRAFYLWRCGMVVEDDFNGNQYHQDACHLKDGFDDYIGNSGFQRDGTGGWHDAGDYGKYTVNAGITVGMLFMAWEHFKPKIEKLHLDLPKTATRLPDFLEEIKWETDWVLKMQYPDGSGKVSHKLTRINFAPFIMADKDDEKRYFTEWSSAATADFVAMMAMAARYFEPYDAAYAKKCLDAAWISYRFLQQNPEEKRFVQGDFKTGGYQTRDADDRLWAAAELWETTGDKTALADFEKRAATMDFKMEENWDWGNVSNLGMFTYALSKRKDKNPEIDKLIKNNIIHNADALVEKGKTDVYARALGGIYFWGCNGTVARQTMNLQIANKLQPKKEYIDTAVGIVDHIFGNNFYNRSFVTGLGINPPMHPHDRRSGADGIEAPWPGYLVGGGHTATDWIDDQESYSLNEIAINWQGALVYALMGFVD